MKDSLSHVLLASQLGGSVCYLAPEVLRDDDPHITTSADMWSRVAVAYIANDQEHLFRTDSNEETVQISRVTRAGSFFPQC